MAGPWAAGGPPPPRYPQAATSARRKASIRRRKFSRSVIEFEPDVAEAVAALELLSDADLWRAARNPLAEADRSQLEALNLKQQKENLTPAEKETLEGLLLQYDRAVLLRAEAARLLKQRGHDVSGLLTAR